MNMNDRDRSRKAAEWFGAAERWIRAGIAVLAALLVLAQLALHYPASRSLLTPAVHGEGTRYRSE